MPKNHPTRSRISLENAPRPTKKQAADKPKLELIYKSPTIRGSFRLSPHTVEVLQDLQAKLNKRLNLKVAQGKIIDMLVLEASRMNIDKIIDLLKK